MMKNRVKCKIICPICLYHFSKITYLNKVISISGGELQKILHRQFKVNYQKLMSEGNEI